MCLNPVLKISLHSLCFLEIYFFCFLFLCSFYIRGFPQMSAVMVTYLYLLYFYLKVEHPKEIEKFGAFK